MFKFKVTGIIALFLALFLLTSTEKAEAKTPPCWAGEGVFVRLDCSYTSYYCGSYHAYIYQQFGRNGKIVDFNLFWPGGIVNQRILKDALEVTVRYPEGFIIEIHFHFVCDGNGCVALSPSGLIKLKYEGMGTIQACGMTAPADYCYYGEVEPRSENVKTLSDVVNDLVAFALSNPPQE